MYVDLCTVCVLVRRLFEESVVCGRPLKVRERSARRPGSVVHAYVANCHSLATLASVYSYHCPIFPSQSTYPFEVEAVAKRGTSLLLILVV